MFLKNIWDWVAGLNFPQWVSSLEAWETDIKLCVTSTNQFINENFNLWSYDSELYKFRRILVNIRAISKFIWERLVKKRFSGHQDYLVCFELTELKEKKTLPNEVEKSFKNQINTKDLSINNLLL